jgi:Predicted nucleic acid-binding protein, contains PIN domain
MSSEAFFLDAAYAIALASPDDDFHVPAVTLALNLKSRQTRMVTTQAVLLEIGDSLSKPRFRPAAVEILSSIARDSRIEVVPLTPDLMRRAFDLFRQRPGKGWGLTDCVSFIVMSEREIHQALTTDEHFEQAGFVALLIH